MKKTLLAMVAMMATGGAAMAQNGITEIADPEALGLEGTCMSPNGKYIAGSCYNTGDGFIYDRETKEMKVFPATVETENDDPDLQMKGVANTGTAVGWDNDTATKFDFTTGKATKTGESGQYLFYGISPSGNLTLGARFDDTNNCPQGTPCYFKDEKPVELPLPSNKFIGYNINGGTALQANDDSLICGFMVDDMATRPAIMWSLNRDGKTFSTYPISRPYFDGAMDSSKPYASFSCDQAIMSPNGKYLIITLEKYVGEWESYYGIARYNTETDSVEVFLATEEDEEMPEVAYGIYGFAISNDGTMVGCAGDMEACNGFIWKKGDERPHNLSSVYTGATRLLAYEGTNKPCAISADGRYITGFAYVLADGADPDDEYAEYNYLSYILDTQDPGAVAPSAVKNATTSKTADGSKVKGYYSLSGKRLDVMNKLNGITIVKTADGKGHKVLVK